MSVEQGGTSRARCFITSLPQEISVHIVKYLSCRDVGRLAHANRYFATICRDDYLWNLLTLRRFGATAASKATEHGHLELYKNLSQYALRLPADQLGIVWLDGHYWKLSDDDTAETGRVAELRSVCFFDVRGRLPGVPRGRYRPFFRLQFLGGRSQGMKNVICKAACVHADAQLHESASSEREIGNVATSNIRPSYPTFLGTLPSGAGDWFNFYLPELNVGDWPGAPEYLDVEFTAIDHSNSWKFGMKIDYIGLERIRDTPTETPVTEPSSTDGLGNEVEGGSEPVDSRAGFGLEAIRRGLRLG
ncbi:hypothetical protein BC832DRAFT_546002 [Gaertneriomyces semiglobifer]|nr:hypothetical protein BC832DRAFT_546002 [Gaertneriomyces semiglobifer]